MEEPEIRAKLRKVYKSMRNRCNNPNEESYKWYGAKGVRVEWEKFKDFYSDMRQGYQVGLTIDRIDSNGNYNRENCRWATQKEQARNRSNNVRLTIDGETLVLAEWIERSGLKITTVHMRIREYGWPIKKALGMKS